MKGITKWLLLSVVIHLGVITLLSIERKEQTRQKAKVNSEADVVIQAQLILAPASTPAPTIDTSTKRHPSVENFADVKEDVGVEKEAKKIAENESGEMLSDVLPIHSKQDREDSQVTEKPNESKTTNAQQAQTTHLPERLTLLKIQRATKAYVQAQEHALNLGIKSKPKNNFTSDVVPSKQLNNRLSHDPMAEKYKGTPVDPIATLADGSDVVKLNNLCMSVSLNEWRDQIWTPTTCPKDADKTGQLLQKSLKKYGLTK